MDDKKNKFIEEYANLCRQYGILIEPCGWHNLIISDELFDKEFKEHLEIELEHFRK